MPFVERKRDASPREVRQFAFGWLPAMCALLAVGAVVRYGSWKAAIVLGAVAAAGVAVAAVRPAWARAVYVAWMAVAYPFGWLLSLVVVATIYFLLVTPIALVMRAAGRDPLDRRLDRGAETYWRRREPPADASRYYRQF